MDPAAGAEFEPIANVATMIAFLTLFGIATRNGIRPVTHIHHVMNVEAFATSVILCGLTTSTLLNMFVVPTLYLKFGSVPTETTAQ